MIAIEGYPGYKLSQDGKVYRNGKMIKPFKNFNDYLRITLWNCEGKKNFYLHRLVAELYVPNPDNLPQVDHLDEDKTNNHYSNLAWVSASQNIRHSFTGRRLNRMSSKERSMIRQMKAEGSSIKQIAKVLNIKGINVQRTLRN